MFRCRRAVTFTTASKIPLNRGVLHKEVQRCSTVSWRQYAAYYNPADVQMTGRVEWRLFSTRGVDSL